MSGYSGGTGMNAREFYEEFKAMLDFVGVGFRGMQDAIVTIRDGKIFVTAGNRSARLDVSRGVGMGHFADDETLAANAALEAEVLRLRLRLWDAPETELATLKAENKWQPISTAPKDNTVFLAWRKHATHPLMVRYEPSYDWFANYDGEHVYDLTHWMPLPKPPAVDTAMSQGEQE